MCPFPYNYPNNFTSQATSTAVPVLDPEGDFTSFPSGPVYGSKRELGEEEELTGKHTLLNGTLGFVQNQRLREASVWNITLR